MISIIVPFCDKDYSLVPRKILQLEKNYPAEEVIFVDDRIDKSAYIDFKNYKHCATEGGTGALFARYSGFKISTQKYIYFSDIDDEALEVSLSLSSDITVFGVNVNGKVFRSFQTKKFNIKKMHDKETKWPPAPVAIWQFIFKRSLLKKFYRKFEIPKTFEINEDGYQVYACVSMAKTLEYKSQTICNYYQVAGKYTDPKIKSSYRYWFEKLDSKSQRLVLYSVARSQLGLS